MSGCGFTPSTCMDDLCRWSSVGLCGAEDPPYSEADVDGEWDDYGDDLLGPLRDDAGS